MIDNHFAMFFPKGSSVASVLPLRTYICNTCKTRLETYDLRGVDDNGIADHMASQHNHTVDGIDVICNDCSCDKGEDE